MADLPVEAWAAIAGVGLLAVVSVLFVLASVVRTEVHVHDLRIDVARARNEYLRELYGQSGAPVGDVDETIDVEIVGEGPAAMSEGGRAAA